ncbi:hypothetical protein ACOME3_002422 [Neoechinorhynchus agilis]
MKQCKFKLVSLSSYSTQTPFRCSAIFQCQHCERQFENPKALSMHMNRTHGSLKRSGLLGQTNEVSSSQYQLIDIMPKRPCFVDRSGESKSTQTGFTMDSVDADFVWRTEQEVQTNLWKEPMLDSRLDAVSNTDLSLLSQDVNDYNWFNHNLNEFVTVTTQTDQLTVANNTRVRMSSREMQTTCDLMDPLFGLLQFEDIETQT